MTENGQNYTKKMDLNRQKLTKTTRKKNDKNDLKKRKIIKTKKNRQRNKK
jgi:hypothetical protein